MSQAEAARAVGVQRQTVNIWLRRYREQGEAGVLDGRRVSPRKGKGVLTAEEARQIRRWITDRSAGQAQAAVRALDPRGGAGADRAALRHRPRAPTRSAATRRRWGFSPQRPGQAGPRAGPPSASGGGSPRPTPRSPPGRGRTAPRSTGATRPGSRTRPPTGAASPPRDRRRWSAAPAAARPPHDLERHQPRPLALHGLRGRAQRRAVPDLPSSA